MSTFTDIFWPTLEKFPVPELLEMDRARESDIAAIRAATWANDPELSLEAAHRLSAAEEERRQTAEGRASTYLLFSAALIPLLTYLESSVWEGKFGNAPKWLSAAIVILAVLYLMGAGYWAFRTLTVSTFHRLSVGELVHISAQVDPRKELVREILIATRQNEVGINRKVSCIRMAHIFLTRAFFAFGILVVVEAGWAIALSLPIKILIEHVSQSSSPAPPPAAPPKS